LILKALTKVSLARMRKAWRDGHVDTKRGHRGSLPSIGVCLDIDEVDGSAATGDQPEVVYFAEMDRESVRELGKLKARIKALEEKAPIEGQPEKIWIPEKDAAVPASGLSKTSTILGIVASVIVVLGTLAGLMMYIVRAELHRRSISRSAISRVSRRIFSIFAAT
jgi:hypothetical protein